MERAVALATMLGTETVDHSLGAAAVHQRFTHEDLVSIIKSAAMPGAGGQSGAHTRTVTDTGQWLSQGTTAWADFGISTDDADNPPSSPVRNEAGDTGDNTGDGTIDESTSQGADQ